MNASYFNAVRLLLEARRRLFAELPGALTDAQKEFLISLVRTEPDWNLMACTHLAEMPAIRWKLENLSRLKLANPGKFAIQQSALKESL